MLNHRRPAQARGRSRTSWKVSAKHGARTRRRASPLWWLSELAAWRRWPESLRERYPAARWYSLPMEARKPMLAIAKDVSGVWVEMPEGSPSNYDLNDYHQAHNLKAVAALLERVKGHLHGSAGRSAPPTVYSSASRRPSIGWFGESSRLACAVLSHRHRMSARACYRSTWPRRWPAGPARNWITPSAPRWPRMAAPSMSRQKMTSRRFTAACGACAMAHARPAACAEPARRGALRHHRGRPDRRRNTNRPRHGATSLRRSANCPT
jgi:hypothetical protein